MNSFFEVYYSELSGNEVNPELLAILDDIIAEMEEEGEGEEDLLDSGDEEDLGSLDMNMSAEGGSSGGEDFDFSEEPSAEPSMESPSEATEEPEDVLPSMNDLAMDFSDNTEEF